MKRFGSHSCLSVLVMLAVVLGSSGCSLLFIDPPPKRRPRLPKVPKCTTSYLAPGIDTVLSAAQGVRGGIAVASDEEDYDDSLYTRQSDMLLGFGLMALYAGSAVYGYSAISRCRDMRAGWHRAAWLTTDSASEAGPAGLASDPTKRRF